MRQPLPSGMSVRCFLVPPHLRGADGAAAIFPVVQGDTVTVQAVRRLFPHARELTFAEAVTRVACRLRGDLHEPNWCLFDQSADSATSPTSCLSAAIETARVYCGTAEPEIRRG